MIIYKKLIVIGTSHISRESINDVKKTISEHKPKIVALELDGQRFIALMKKKGGKIGIKDIRKIGLSGYIFSILGSWIEKKLGKIVGVSPGSEMVVAAKEARKNNCKIALIDQNIQITLRKLSKRITLREIFRFFLDIFTNPFKYKKFKFDLKKVPDNETIEKILDFVMKRYPNIYDVLIKERNIIMAKRLFDIIKEYNVVAVVGAGHEKEIIKEIKKLEN